MHPGASDVALSAADRSSLYRPIFVGREAELQQLQAAYDRAVQGKPALVALAGEPGIGKTALCTELARYVTSRGGCPLWGHCAEADSLTLAYLPIVQALDAYASSAHTAQLEEDLGSTAKQIARIVVQIRERLSIEIQPAGDPEEDRWQLFQAVTTFLRNVAARQPIVLVLEDLHEADRGTLDLLVHVARHLGDARLFVLGAYRDMEVDRTHPLSSTLAELRRFPHFARRGLRGLTVAEVHQFYCQLRGRDVPLSWAETVHRQTEGNPLFVQEVLRYLVEVGLVVQREGGYVPIDAALIETDVPEGLRDIVGKRLSRLSERSNEVLHIAAVIGQEFRLDVLQRVSGLGEEVVFAALEEAHARAIIEESGGFGASVRFRFTHSFFRQTLYDEIFAPRRIRWHRAVGGVLEEIYGDHLEDHAGELARHYAHSSDPADLARAIAYDELAAQQAMRVSAYGEAARHLERALQVETVLEVRDPRKRCDLLLALGEAMLAMQQPRDAVVRVAAEAFDLAESLAEAPRAARAAVQVLDGLSRPWLSNPVSLPRTSDTRKWVERADCYAAQGSTERVYADIWLGMFDRPGPIDDPLLRAVDLARDLGDDFAYGAAAGFALTHVLAPHHVDTVARLAAQFQSHSHHRMRAADLAHGLSAAGRLLISSGDRDGAEHAWGELDHLAGDSRDAMSRLLGLTTVACRAFLDGRLEEVATQKDLEDKLGEELGIEAAANVYTRLAAVRARHYLGQDITENLSYFPDDQRRIPVRAYVGCRAMILGLLGRREEALALRARFVGIETDADTTALLFLAIMLEVSVRCGDQGTATALVSRLAHLSNRLDGSLLVSYGRLLGQAAVMLDRPADARGYFDQALDVCARARCRPELALTRLALAELLVARYPDEHALAADQLRLAVPEFESMRMQPSLTRALELGRSEAPAHFRRVAATSDRVCRDPVDTLTKREREVATLLSQGMSNREIASTLVISQSTAEVHVKHVLSKLGLRSRSQVAAWAAQRDRPV